MRIEERGYSMITDEQGREWLLKKFYEFGCNKIDTRTAVARFLSVDGANSMTLGYVPNTILGVQKGSEFIDIAEELGIIDWSKVAVDTPVLVRDFEEMQWGKRYFAFFKDGKVHTWNGGVTSWTCENPNCVMSWVYAKLAEV